MQKFGKIIFDDDVSIFLKCSKISGAIVFVCAKNLA